MQKHLLQDEFVPDSHTGYVGSTKLLERGLDLSPLTFISSSIVRGGGVISEPYGHVDLGSLDSRKNERRLITVCTVETNVGRDLRHELENCEWNARRKYIPRQVPVCPQRQSLSSVEDT